MLKCSQTLGFHPQPLLLSLINLALCRKFLAFLGASYHLSLLLLHLRLEGLAVYVHLDV